MSDRNTEPDPAPTADGPKWDRKRKDLYTFVACAVSLATVAKRLGRTKDQTVAALVEAWKVD